MTLYGIASEDTFLEELGYIITASMARKYRVTAIEILDLRFLWLLHHP
jgi:hypothetical protein